VLKRHFNATGDHIGTSWIAVDPGVWSYPPSEPLKRGCAFTPRRARAT